MKKILILSAIAFTSCTTAHTESDAFTREPESWVGDETPVQVLHRFDVEGCCTPGDLLWIEQYIGDPGSDPETVSYLEAAVEGHELGEPEGKAAMFKLAHESAHKH